MESSPKISVLIATDNHPPDLDLFFDRLIGQTLPGTDYECVIIDSSHTHDYGPAYRRALERADRGLRLVYQRSAKGGRAVAYNHGLPLCRAPLVLFLGDDMLPWPATVETHLRFHEAHPDLHRVGIGAALFPVPLRTHFSVWAETSGELFGAVFRRDMSSVPDNFFYIANASIKRAFLLQAGPFDENFRFHAWDDYELGLRLCALGMKSEFLPAATAEHHHDVTLRERCRLIFEAGQSAAVFDVKYPGAHPWHRTCCIPAWRHRLSATWMRLRYLLRGGERDLTGYYRRRLDAAFAAGYRRAGGPALARRESV
ncbi:MAG: glycosyltransferase family 2 protein [Hyphomicrobiales bacterium]|nr:glycosyltransferase family 2 protein [Hyphomicrobiales bacterium]